MRYSKKVLDHFLRPRNQGTIKNPDAVVIIGNPKCGDLMKFYIKVGKNKQGEETIKEAKFETLGCGVAIATSSVATELAKGKTLSEMMEITCNDIIKELGELPKSKIHCSVLADKGLRKAIEAYRKKKSKKLNNKNF